MGSNAQTGINYILDHSAIYGWQVYSMDESGRVFAVARFASEEEAVAYIASQLSPTHH